MKASGIFYPLWQHSYASKISNPVLLGLELEAAPTKATSTPASENKTLTSSLFTSSKFLVSYRQYLGEAPGPDRILVGSPP